MNPWMPSLALAGALTPNARAATQVPGEVLYEQVISASAGGMSGLEAGDQFQAVEPLGDFDEDGVPDLAVGALGDDEGGANRGAVHLLLLERDGTVAAQLKIDSSTDGFSGQLEDEDLFGIVANLGDLDGDGVVDLAVSGLKDDDAGTDAGAVWILFLNANGTVKSHRKLTEGQNGFSGVLDPGDEFGSDLSNLGDLDGDGVIDLAVGAWRDDDGGTDRGAVWILFLAADGSVRSQAKISSTSGGFTGPLGDGDRFGISLDGLGDLDGLGGSTLALAVGANEHDHLVTNDGAIWVLFLSASGAVLSEQKISESSGGFGGDLETNGLFGTEVESLGNIGGPGVVDLAVGMTQDDDGVTDGGCLWILSLGASGSVLQEQKISATEGHFGGALDAGDHLGVRIARIGDLDRDGRVDLATSAQYDDSAGPFTGAVWVLFLNDGTFPLGTGSTEWTGAIDQDWSDASNWTNGVPNSSKSAIVPAVANDPIVADNLQACYGLLLEPGATLQLDGSLAVHGGATLHGTIPGTGELRAAGAGTFAGTGTVLVKVSFEQSASVQGGPLTVDDDLDVRADLELQGGSELQVTGMADLVPSTSGELSGTGTLDLDGSLVDLRMSAGSSSPRLEIAGDLSLDSSIFVPTSGSVRFDGAGAQSVTQLGAGATRLSDVEVAPGADVSVPGNLTVSGDLTLDGELDVGNSVEVGGDLTGGSGANLSGQCITFQGSYQYGGFLSTACMITFAEPSAATLVMNAANPFPTDVDVQIGGTMLLFSLSVQGDLNVLDGTLEPGQDLDLDVGALVVEAGACVATGGFRLGLPGAPPVTVRGELAVRRGGRLELSASPVSIEPGGTFRVDTGIVRGLSGGGYDLSIGAGGTISAIRFSFRDMASTGVRIHRDALLAPEPYNLQGGKFSLGAAGGVLLDIERSTPTTLKYVSFGNPGGATSNVRVAASSAEITILDTSGVFSGPSFEDDPGNLLTWDWSKLGRAGGSGLSALGPGDSDQPPGRPSPAPPAPARDAIAAFLSAPGSASVACLTLEPGRYSGFDLGGGCGRAIRIVGSGAARIDGPIVVRGLGPGETLELCGVQLLGTELPALQVEDSAGAVWLEAVRIHGEVRSMAGRLLLDSCSGGRLRLERGSYAQAREARFGALELQGGSCLDSWDLRALPVVEPGSSWREHGALPARLGLVADDQELFMRLDAPSGPTPRIGWLCSSSGLEPGGTTSGWALLRSAAHSHGWIRPGQALALPLPGDDRRYLQAVWLDPLRRTLTCSNVVAGHARP